MEREQTSASILKEDCTMTQAFDRFRQRAAALPSPFLKAETIRQAFPQLADAVLRDGRDSFSGLHLLPGNSEKSQIGNPPGWHDNPYQNNEYVFQLNRMNHWLPMLYSYFLTGEEAYGKKILDEMADWIDACPRKPLFDFDGKPQTSYFNSPDAREWRLLECGIRLYRTWCPVLEGLADSPWLTETLFSKALHSIYEHCETVYRLSPLAWPKADHNHYLMENLGLLCASCMFPELKHADTWKDHAIRELCRCMDAQVDDQGAQIEGCPSYHNGCVFWFAMVLVYSRKYVFSIPESYRERFSRMAEYALYATRPNGANVPWGDTGTLTGTMVKAAVCTYMGTGDSRYLHLCQNFFSYEDLLTEAEEQIWRMDHVSEFCAILANLNVGNADAQKQDLDRKPDGLQLPLLCCYKALDHVYARTGWDRDALSVLFACRTPIQNNHAHIDSCGFDFTALGVPMVVDPGRYTYKNGEDRRNFKSMKWHNTLTVNHRDAWEYLHSWGYGPQKEGGITAWAEDDGLLWAMASHRNYEPVIHTRAVALVDGTFLLVIDRLEGLSPTDSIEIQFHVDRPGLLLEDSRALAFWEGGQSLAITSTIRKAILLPGKVSDRNDVYRDSTILQYQEKSPSETAVFASVLYPAKGCLPPQVENLTADDTVRFTINDTRYEFTMDQQLRRTL